MSHSQLRSEVAKIGADTVRVFDTVRTTIVDTQHTRLVDTVGVVLPTNDSTGWANAVLTFGLLAFAGMQWWVTRQAEKARRVERSHDLADRKANADRAADVAFQIVWAEHFRLQSLADRWREEDLVMLAALGVLRSETLLPRDWPTVVQSLSALSAEAGYLGGVALTLAHDTEVSVATLIAIVRSYERQYPNAPPIQIAQIVQNNGAALTDPLVTAVRSASRDLALLLWDAARHTPRADLQRQLSFRDDLHSEFGKGMVSQLERRGSP